MSRPCSPPILAQTASNITDLSAVDSRGVEQHKYMDLARQYSNCLVALNNSLTR